MKVLAFLLILCGSSQALWRRAGDPLGPARGLFEAGRYAEVVSSLELSAMQKLRGRNLRQAYLYLGESQERLGFPDKALGVYQVAVKLFPEDAELLTQTARLLHASGLDEQAQPLYDQVLALQPENTLANLGLAEIDHSLGFLDRSAQRYEKALQGDLAAKAGLWRAYAEVLHQQKDYVTAEEAARKAISLAREPESIVDLAFILRSQGRHREAVETLSELIGSKPQTPLRRLLTLWLIEEGRLEPAAALCAELLRQEPDEPLNRYLSARLHLKAGRRGQAAKDLELAAAGFKKAPFVAKVSAEMIKGIEAGR